MDTTATKSVNLFIAYLLNWNCNKPCLINLMPERAHVKTPYNIRLKVYFSIFGRHFWTRLLSKSATKTEPSSAIATATG